MAEENNFIKTVFIISAAVFLVSASAVKTYEYLKEEGKTINIDDADAPVIIPCAENCLSPYVENEVLYLFKESSPLYKSISVKSIDSRSVKEKLEISKDDKSQKYVCSGIIEIQSAPDGFRPETYDFENTFYNQIYIPEDDLKIKKYTFYEIPVIYVSQMTEDGNTAYIESLAEGKLGCTGECLPVYKSSDITEKPAPENNNFIDAGYIKNTGRFSPQEKKEPKLKKFFNFFRRNKS